MLCILDDLLDDPARKVGFVDKADCGVAARGNGLAICKAEYKCTESRPAPRRDRVHGFVWHLYLVI